MDQQKNKQKMSDKVQVQKCASVESHRRSTKFDPICFSHNKKAT